MLALDGGLHLGQVGLGGSQQSLSFLGPLGAKGGVAAGHEALTFVVGVGYLGEAHLVEQAHLERPRSCQGGDRRRPQGGQPTEAAHFFERRDTGRGDHPPVAHHHDVGEAEAHSHGLCCGYEGGRVGGVAGEDLDGYGAALGVAGEAVLYLGFAYLAVT